MLHMHTELDMCTHINTEGERKGKKQRERELGSSKKMKAKLRTMGTKELLDKKFILQRQVIIKDYLYLLSSLTT